jgi:predicted ATP-dependent endonuclease of OLD family
MRLSKVIINNYKSLKKAMIVFEDKLLTLVGENESGKSNALEAISKIDLSRSLTWHDTTYFSEEYTARIKPTIRYELYCTEEEHNILKNIYPDITSVITIERSEKTKDNEFLIVSPKINILPIGIDNIDNVLDEYKKYLSSCLEYIDEKKKPENEQQSTIIYSSDTTIKYFIDIISDMSEGDILLLKTEMATKININCLKGEIRNIISHKLKDGYLKKHVFLKMI